MVGQVGVHVCMRVCMFVGVLYVSLEKTKPRKMTNKLSTNRVSAESTDIEATHDKCLSLECGVMCEWH